MRTSLGKGLIAVTGVALAASACSSGIEPGVENERAGGDQDVSTDVASTSEALSTLQICAGTTRNLVFVRRWVPCELIPLDQFYQCNSWNGCERNQYAWCVDNPRDNGWGGAWVTFPEERTVQCSTFSVDSCLQYPGCYLQTVCQRHCNGSTLIACNSNQEFPVVCEHGCEGPVGNAYCVPPPCVESCNVTCDPGFTLCGDLCSCNVFCYSPDWTPDPACPAH